MSFFEQCKDELFETNFESDLQQLVFLSAVLKQCGSLHIDSNGAGISIDTEGLEAIKIVSKILSKNYRISAEIDINKPNTVMKNHSYSLKILPKNTVKILNDCKMVRLKNDEIVDLVKGISPIAKEGENLKIYLRALFLCNGYVGVPNSEESGYHLEIVLQDEVLACEIVEELAKFDIPLKSIQRNEAVGLYIKDSSVLSDFLAFIGAPSSVVELNCIIADRSLRNQINRQNNCSLANIDKAIEAGQKQYNAILLIDKKVGLGSLNEKLREIAELRLKNPEYTLEQIASEVQTPLSKSGLNHRFRKLLEIASELEEKI